MVFIIVSALLFLNDNAQALTTNEQTTIQKLNKKIQRDNERIFEEEERKINQRNLLKQSPKVEIIPETKTPKTDKKEQCFLIKEIILNDSKSLLKKERGQLVNKYQNQCLSLADIDQLRIEINNFYINKGYIMSRSYLKPDQNIKNGVLEFEIKEGEIEEISINDNAKLSDKVRLSTAFPYTKSQSFNLRDIEQGLDQINRLQSSNASLKILPGTSEGTSIVEIANQETKTTHGSISYDNNGQESTGERRRVLTLQQDNLLMLNDSFYINYSHDQEGNNQARNSKSLYANLSIPYGYWLYSLSVTDSKYLSTIQLTNSTIKSSGNSRSYIADVSRIIHRNKTSTTSLVGILTTINTESFADGSKLDTSSRKLTTFDIGLKHKLRLNNAIIMGGIDYVRGLNSFGALQDQPNLPDDYPKAQFELLKFNTTFYKAFNLASQEISYRGTVVGQWSKDTLYSSEQISIGDPFSVRGFKNNSIASDNGGYIRNELSIKIPPIIRKFYIDRALANTELFVGYDTGFVKSKSDSDLALDGKNKSHLSGWSAGIRKSDKYFDCSLTYSKAIHSPQFVDVNDKEIYFNITLSI